MNDAQTHVAEALEGFELAHRDLVALNREPAYVTRRNLSATPKVGQPAPKFTLWTFDHKKYSLNPKL